MQQTTLNFFDKNLLLGFPRCISPCFNVRDLTNVKLIVISRKSFEKWIWQSQGCLCLCWLHAIVFQPQMGIILVQSLQMVSWNFILFFVNALYNFAKYYGLKLRQNMRRRVGFQNITFTKYSILFSHICQIIKLK